MAKDYTVIINSFTLGDAYDADTLKTVASTLRKHEKAASCFIGALSKLNEKEYKRAIGALAASWRFEQSRSGVSYDYVCDKASLMHKAAKLLRDDSAQAVNDAAKDRDGFDTAREQAEVVRMCNVIMVSASNLLNISKQIVAKLDQVLEAASA